MPTFTSETSDTAPSRTVEAVIECWGEVGGDGIVTNGNNGGTGVGGVGGYIKALQTNISPGDTLYIRFPSGGSGIRRTGEDKDGNLIALEAGDGGRGADVRLNSTSHSAHIVGAGGGGGGGAANNTDTGIGTDGGGWDNNGQNRDKFQATVSGGYSGNDGSPGGGGKVENDPDDVWASGDRYPGNSGSGATGGNGVESASGTNGGKSGGGGAGYYGGGSGAAVVDSTSGSRSATGTGGGGGSNHATGSIQSESNAGGSGPQVSITYHQVPVAPSNLSGNFDGSSINLSWTDNSSTEDGFRIYRGTSSGNLSALTTVGANTTSYSDGSVSAGTTYYYQVFAYNTYGESSGSNEESVQTSAPPSTPQNLTSSEL